LAFILAASSLVGCDNVEKKTDADTVKFPIAFECDVSTTYESKKFDGELKENIKVFVVLESTLIGTSNRLRVTVTPPGTQYRSNNKLHNVSLNDISLSYGYSNPSADIEEQTTINRLTGSYSYSRETSRGYKTGFGTCKVKKDKLF